MGTHTDSELAKLREFAWIRAYWPELGLGVSCQKVLAFLNANVYHLSQNHPEVVRETSLEE